MKKICPVRKAEREEPEVRRSRIYRILSVPVGVMELAAALLYMICSLFFIWYGYEDYLMNRSWTLPAGCLLAVVALQFLAGETILHRYTALRWRAVVYETGVWMICLLMAEAALRWRGYLREEGVWRILLLAEENVSARDYLSILEYFGVAVFLAALPYLVLCPFSLFSKYGKKSGLYALIMLALELFELKAGVDSGKVSWLAFAVLLLLPAASFCAGAFHHLVSGWIRKKWETGRKQILLKRAVLVLLAGGIFFGLEFFTPKELPEITPRQDEEGYYLLCTREGFEWFIDRINRKNEEHNVSARLTADIVLNDTSNWENWAEEMPEYQYDDMGYYSGHFDGNGHVLEGYYSKWESPIFIRLEKEALVTDLKIRKSLFQSTYGESSYVDDEGEVGVVSAAALCLFNEGRIEGCDVEAVVLGDWSAGGIASINYGVIEDCSFAGTVEAGRWLCDDSEGECLMWKTIKAGGICRANLGSIRSCLNEGTVLCEAVNGAYNLLTDFAAGGIAGSVDCAGSVENCKNTGDIWGTQFSGGIAGISAGEIDQCANMGKVHVEQAEPDDYPVSLITAGICASNSGLVDSCWNTGEVSVCQETVSFRAPIYGIACNWVDSWREGRTENCYYLSEKAKQDYRQSGVYKLSETEMAEVERYVAAGQSAAEKQDEAERQNKKGRQEPDRTDVREDMTDVKDAHDRYVISDVDSWELFTALPDYPGTDEDDYIHLHMGPEQDTTYEVQPGDTLWKIAESFYGDGVYYDRLLCPDDPAGGSDDGDLIHPGERIRVPGLDYYLLCANDEEGFGWCVCQDVSGEKSPARYFAAKPKDWCHGYMRNFVAHAGLEVLWPKDKEAERETAAGDIRIFCYMDGNPEGDFLAGEWESAKKKIAESAGIYCKEGMENLRFYRYELDNGESLYGYSFRLYPDRCPFESELKKGVDVEGTWEGWESSEKKEFRGEEALDCAVFYRMREGFLAEFIGIEPAAEDMDVLARTRYLAARIGDGPAIEENSAGELFYGREDWAYKKLHNPFATALEYSPEKECNDHGPIKWMQ